jgi:YgiT-type zinc finger domain-containing protein
MKENSKLPESALRCKYCGYGTREDVIKAAFWMDDGLIVVEDVLAQVCEGCGEQFLDEETTQQIQELLKNRTVEPGRQIRVSVYDLSRLESMAKRRRSQSIRVSRDPETNLQCKYCESETVEELVKSAFWVNEQLIAIENIRARVCRGCKVQFYDDETAEGIATLEKIRTVPDAARRDVTVSVFSLADKENTVGNRFHQDTSDRFCER